MKFRFLLLLLIFCLVHFTIVVMYFVGVEEVDVIVTDQILFLQHSQMIDYFL